MCIMSNSLGKFSAVYVNVFSYLMSTLLKIPAEVRFLNKIFLNKEESTVRALYKFLTLIRLPQLRLPRMRI